MGNVIYAKKINLYNPHRHSPRLVKLHFELTDRCNNNCTHCYINLPENDLQAARKELSTERIQTILLEAASLGCIEVVFTGGEPLLRKDFAEIYIFSQKIGFTVTILTNATLINRHFATLFKKMPPKGGVYVTVYGMDENTYQKVSRTPGAFHAAWEGIRLLRKYKIPFHLKGILLPDNSADCEKFIELTKKIPSLKREGPAFIFPLHLRARRDNLRKNQAIARLRISKKRQIEYLRSRKSEFMEDAKKFCMSPSRPPSNILFKCGAGIESLCVDAYGYLQPCLLMRHPKTLYDLNQGSLQEAMTNFFPELRKMKAHNPEYLKMCARCFLKGYCEQCPAVSYMETGTLDTPVKYYCDHSHLWARFFGLLGPGEKAWEVKDWRNRFKKFISL
jgi:radical SAM protein with 4Fe4S-binding SPASM domain